MHFYPSSQPHNLGRSISSWLKAYDFAVLMLTRLSKWIYSSFDQSWNKRVFWILFLKINKCWGPHKEQQINLDQEREDYLECWKPEFVHFNLKTKTKKRLNSLITVLVKKVELFHQSKRHPEGKWSGSSPWDQWDQRHTGKVGHPESVWHKYRKQQPAEAQECYLRVRGSSPTTQVQRACNDQEVLNAPHLQHSAVSTWKTPSLVYLQSSYCYELNCVPQKRLRYYPQCPWNDLLWI